MLAPGAHTHPGSPAWARDVTSGRGADLLVRIADSSPRGGVRRGRGGGGGTSHLGIGLFVEPLSLSPSPGRESLGGPAAWRLRRHPEEGAWGGGRRGRGQWAGAGCVCGKQEGQDVSDGSAESPECPSSSSLPSCCRPSSPRCSERGQSRQGCAATHRRPAGSQSRSVSPLPFSFLSSPLPLIPFVSLLHPPPQLSLPPPSFWF